MKDVWLDQNKESDSEDAIKEKQRKELSVEAYLFLKDEIAGSLAAEALDQKYDNTIQFVLSGESTRSQLMAVMQYMTALGIEYTKQ